MKKGFPISLLFTAIILMAWPAGVSATEITSHTLRFTPGNISLDYTPPQFGSIDLPESGKLIYPYSDGRFSLAIDAPKTVFAGDQFSIGTAVKSLMNGPEDANWGYWVHYQQLFAPPGITSPATWSQQLNCYYRPGAPELASGNIMAVSPGWMTDSRWYSAGVVAYPHNGGTVVVGTNMVSHGMGPWIWLQDADEVIWNFSSFVADDPGDYTFEIFFTNSMYGDTIRNDWQVDYEPIRFTVQVVDKTVPAQLQIDPKTLNTKSKGNWISAKIESPDCDLSLTDLNTVKLNGVAADLKFFHINDSDFDGAPELTIKFPRDAVIASLNGKGNITLSVTGSAGGLNFAGADTIKVI